MNIELALAEELKNVLHELYQIDIQADASLVQPTRKEFEGDLTIVVFPYVKLARKAPDKVAKEIGDRLCERMDALTGYNVVKGYLNLSVADGYWLERLREGFADERYGLFAQREEAPVLIEYSSPNTNKPLHLGHVRNNLLGHSVSQILMACGHPVVQVNLVNDRGIHICKSMVAWLRYGNGETKATIWWATTMWSSTNTIKRNKLS